MVRFVKEVSMLTLLGISARLMAAPVSQPGSQEELPYTFPHRKVWWAKQLSKDICTAGRLTETQLKFAIEAGFKTIISQDVYEEEGNIGEELLPTTSTARHIVENLSGSVFHSLLEEGQVVESEWTVKRFTKLVSEAEKPILYFSTNSKSATFIALVFLAKQACLNGGGDPAVASKEVYRKGASLGFHFASTAEKKLVSDITGAAIISDPPPPHVSLADWYEHYWLMKPVYNNWYDSGQTLLNYFPQIKAAGFQVVVNTRRGVTTRDKPSQEEVTLLNVQDEVVKKSRQEDSVLRQFRINPELSAEYVDGVVNYQSRAPLQFGDDVGYNETIERVYIEKQMGMEYFLTPIRGDSDYNMDRFDQLLDTWKKAGEFPHVFLHCRSGHRAAAMGILVAGHQYGLDADWALQKAKDMGYHFDLDDEGVPVMKMFEQVLGKK